MTETPPGRPSEPRTGPAAAPRPDPPDGLFGPLKPVAVTTEENADSQ